MREGRPVATDQGRQKQHHDHQVEGHRYVEHRPRHALREEHGDHVEEGEGSDRSEQAGAEPVERYEVSAQDAEEQHPEEREVERRRFHDHETDRRHPKEHERAQDAASVRGVHRVRGRRQGEIAHRIPAEAELSASRYAGPEALADAPAR